MLRTPPGRSSRRGLRRAARFWFLAGLLGTLEYSKRGQATDLDDMARENHLRAGFVFNFAKFIEWPASVPADELGVCFAGAAGIRDAFATAFAGKQIGTHRLVLRNFSGRDSTAGCQILYIELSAAGAPRPPSSDNSGVLSVGDQRDFIHQGGIVELFPDNNRLRFNINLDLARRAGLKISSSLLQLASRVEGTAP